MKTLFLIQFVSLIYLANCWPFPIDLIFELAKITKLEFDALKDIVTAADHVPQALTGFSLVPCPAQSEPPSDFTWEDFKGTWHEIERTAMFEILETGQKCTQFSFTKESDEFKINTTVFSEILNKQLSASKTINVKDQKNVFGVKINPIKESQYWIVDTDLDSYALIFSCEQILQASLRNAWILGRKPTLHESIRDLLVKKLGSLGIPESSLIKSDQSCSTFIPL